MTATNLTPGDLVQLKPVQRRGHARRHNAQGRILELVTTVPGRTPELASVLWDGDDHPQTAHLTNLEQADNSQPATNS